MKAHVETVLTGTTPWFTPNTTLVLDLPSESPVAIPRTEIIRFQTVSLTVMIESDIAIEVEGRRIEFNPWANGLRPILFNASGYWFVFNKGQIQALEGYDYDGIDFQMKYMDPERLYAAKFNPALGYLEIHAEEGLFAEAETSGSGGTKRMRLLYRHRPSTRAIAVALDRVKESANYRALKYAVSLDYRFAREKSLESFTFIVPMSVFHILPKKFET